MALDRLSGVSTSEPVKLQGIVSNPWPHRQPITRSGHKATQMWERICREEGERNTGGRKIKVMAVHALYTCMKLSYIKHIKDF